MSSDSDDRKEAPAVKNSADNVEKMVRTPDEWRSAGLDNAVVAESCNDFQEAEECLEKTVYCFEQIGDTSFESKARVNRSRVEFRRNLEDASRGENAEVHVAQTEVEAALLSEKLLADRFLLKRNKLVT